MIKKIFTLSAFAVFLGVNAQKSHTVVKGDNLYNISKRYGMSLDELVRLNPSVKDGQVNIGQVLFVNNKSEKPIHIVSSVDKNINTELGYIIIQPKQTIYGISKQYKISESELRNLNPNLEAQMKIGNRLNLPLANIKKYGDSIAIADTTTEIEHSNISTVNSVDSDSYQVQPKDNYFRITRKFNISKQQLFAMNPGLEEKGLKVGDVIRVKGITVENTISLENKNTASSSQNNDEHNTYTVKESDTVFGILNKFDISLDELLSLNPQLSNGLKAGMILKVKKLDASYVKKSGDALNVVLMLPFGFDTNDEKFRAMSTDFLTGAKLAIERNAGQGQKLDVKIIDARNENSFKNSLTQINKDNTDLIIGPFFKSNVLEVLNYVGNKKIPVVAPFANSEDLYDFDNLIIVETNDDFYIKKIVDEVGKSYSNQKIYILADAEKTNANAIKSGLEKSLKNANVTIVNSALDIQEDKNMMTGEPVPVISILASKEDSKGTEFANRLIELSKEVSGLKSFSIYYHSIFEKKEDALTAANLVYLMDRKINAEGNFEKEILAEYKNKFCKTPSKYAIIGFDVMNDVLMRENKSGEIFKQMHKTQTQLATKFEYARAKKNGAYINTGHRVVRLITQ